MALFRKSQKKLKQKSAVPELTNDEVLKLSIKEKLKNYKRTQGRAEFSGVLVIPKGDRAHLPQMEFEVFGMDGNL